MSESRLDPSAAMITGWFLSASFRASAVSSSACTATLSISCFSTQHSTLNTQHSTPNTHHPTLITQHSTFNTQHSTLNTQHSGFQSSSAGTTTLSISCFSTQHSRSQCSSACTTKIHYLHHENPINRMINASTPLENQPSYQSPASRLNAGRPNQTMHPLLQD
ncbi:hypothetical protein T484DRAFT_2978511 [Baffinella frigidus]|nr:hypothetical protein T484DRAFT_2978511 [Cryptophyta sp. CCMP2293]